MWKPASTAPFDRHLQLAVINRLGTHALVFPCRRILGGWMKVGTVGAFALSDHSERCFNSLSNHRPLELIESADDLKEEPLNRHRGVYCLPAPSG
jgi:hypothetical protein